jgi:tetratricopeptide (TPR) repeat protein
VLLAYAEECRRLKQPQPYFWFDLFTNNQHDTSEVPQSWWATTFKKQIGEIGTTLLVLLPWSDPVPLHRCWCLWELLCTLQEKANLVIRLPREQQAAFHKALVSNFHGVLDSLVKIDAAKAQAWRPADRDMIAAAIKAAGGFAVLNSLVKEHLRNWLLSTSEARLAELQSGAFLKRDQKEDLARFSLSLGGLCSSLGKYDRAIALYAEARAIYRQLGQRKGEGVAYMNAGLAYGNLKQPEKVIQFMTQALERGHQEPSAKANCSIALGNAHLDLGAALILSLLAPALRFRRASNTHFICCGVGHAQDALGIFQDALEVLVEVHGERSAKVAFAHNNGS